MTEKHFTRQEAVEEVIKVVKELENHQLCTTNSICKAVQKRYKHLPNYIIRDALRTAQRQNKLKMKKNKYYISLAPSESTRHEAKLTTTNQRLHNYKTKELEKSIKNSSTNLKSRQNKKQHKKSIPLRETKRRDSKIIKRKGSIKKCSSCCNTKETQQSQTKVKEKYICPDCEEIHNNKESGNLLSSGIEHEEVNLNSNGVEETVESILKPGLVQRLVTNCKKFFLLPLIDPNCDLEDYE